MSLFITDPRNEVQFEWHVGQPIPPLMRPSNRLLHIDVSGDELDMLLRAMQKTRQSDNQKADNGFPSEIWESFHKVWTWAVGKPGYKKAKFRELEADLLEIYRQESGK